MERTVRGRPGRPGRDRAACRRARRSRCQPRVRPDQQPEPAKHIAREPVQQGGQERPVGRGEPRPGHAQLPLQHGDLVAQRQDLGILVPVAHPEKPQ
jgi:hypothetical protein